MFTQKIDKDFRNHLIMIPSSSKKYMSDHIPYTFRQNSDFLYLTGCLEPDCCLVIVLSTDTPERTILFLRPNDKNAELWEGSRTGVERAPSFFGMQESMSIVNLQNFLASNTKNTTIWFDKDQCDFKSVGDIMANFSVSNPNIKIEAPTVFIQKLRVVKSPSEIKLMRKSCEIASKAINNTIASSFAGISEHFLYAKVDSDCRMLGAQRLAYPPVIAGGARANTIHYIENNQIINKGELVLMDAGCEYNGFSSDITRTWPIDGNFTKEQRLLYEMLLAVQTELISQVHTCSLDALFNTMCILLGTGLQKLGIMQKNLNELQLAQIAYSFCPHHVSHYLGMDVHDTPLISRSIPLQPGMIVTIEPGIYIPVDRQDVPEKFRGIGLRIEDDILITSNGNEVLTNTCAKTICDIESLITNKICVP